MNDAVPLSAYRQLKPVERKFVDAYVSELERSAVAAEQQVIAFIALGGTVSLASDDLAKRPMVKAAVAERIRDLSESLDITQYRVLKEIGTIAFSRMDNYVRIDEYGLPTFDFSACTPEQWSSVQMIEVKEDKFGCRTYKLKLYDKPKGLDMLMRNMGMYDADNRQRATPAGVPQLTDETTTEQAADLWARTIRGD